jgi:uncharacterized protein YecT (DUF1311 family)
MRILLFFFAFFAVAGTAMAQCEEKRTTLDISQCLSGELKKADAELNRTYEQTLKRVKASDADLLKKAQRAWMEYREAHCQAEFELWDGGTGGQIALPQCKLTLTKRRITEIQETYNPEKH